MAEKKYKTIFLFLFIFILFDSGFILAQKEFSLQEAVDYALENSPKIIISKNKIEKAKAILKDAKRLIDLDISVHFGYSPLTDKKGVGIGVSQDLDKLLGGNRKEKEIAQLELDSAKQEFFLVQQEVIKETTVSFNNLENSKSNLRLREKTSSDDKKSFEFAKERFDLGLISIDELLAKEQKMEQSKIEFQQALRQLGQAYMLFYQTIGYKEE